MISVPRTGVISSTVMKALSIEVSGKGDMRCLRATLVMSTALWPETKTESLHTLAHASANCTDNGHPLALKMFSLLLHRDWTYRYRERQRMRGNEEEREMDWERKKRDRVRAQKELHPPSRSVCIPLTGFFKIGMIIYTFRRNNQTKLAIKKKWKHFQSYCHYYHYHHGLDIMPNGRLHTMLYFSTTQNYRGNWKWYQ